MRYFLIGSLLVLILSITMVAPQAEASDPSSGLIPSSSIGKIGPLATWESDFLAWLRSTLRDYLSNPKDNYPTRSVPLPGTLLLFGASFVGLVVWRARRNRV